MAGNSDENGEELKKEGTQAHVHRRPSCARLSYESFGFSLTRPCLAATGSLPQLFSLRNSSEYIYIVRKISTSPSSTLWPERQWYFWVVLDYSGSVDSTGMPETVRQNLWEDFEEGDATWRLVSKNNHYFSRGTRSTLFPLHNSRSFPVSVVFDWKFYSPPSSGSRKKW